MASHWRDDPLPGYRCRDLPITGERAPGEEVDPVATLVRRVAPHDDQTGDTPPAFDPASGRRWAVLYLHGWNDYFFQDHLAGFWASLGFDFFALDLRRYGRSLRPTQLAGYISDLSEYDAELDLAVTMITDGDGDEVVPHDRVVIMGHSTGGLISALWVHDHPDRAAGLVLNSPWLDLQGAPLIKALGRPVVDAVGSRAGTTVIPLPDNGFYHRVLHAAADGEWDFDTTWKATGAPIRAGWLRAVLQGHSRIAKGLDISAPVLVMASTRTSFRRTWDPELFRVDSVLDVDQIASRAAHLGTCVTIVRIADGLHDLVLSAPEVRAKVLVELARWSGGYLTGAVLGESVAAG